MSAFWAEDGDYVDDSAHRFEGRVAIENAFKEFFAENKDLKLRTEINSLALAVAGGIALDGVPSPVLMATPIPAVSPTLAATVEDSMPGMSPVRTAQRTRQESIVAPFGRS